MRRHRWVLSGLLGAALVVGACGADQVETSEAPGFSDSQKEVDRSPFSMAEPRSEGGATTLPSPTLPLPENLEALVRPETPTTTTTTTTTTTPATTTTLPANIRVPDPGTIFDLCGFSEMIVSLRLVPTDPSVDLRALSTAIRRALNRYEIVAPAELSQTVKDIAGPVRQILDAIDGDGQGLTSPRVRDLLDRAAVEAPPFQGLSGRVGTIRGHELAVCPRG
jgi:hypothetical protein